MVVAERARTTTEPLRYTFRTKPYSHQLRALEKVRLTGGRCGLFMPMRTGKTKAAVDWAGIAYHNLNLRHVLVVCPADPVMSVWEREIATHSPVPVRIVALRGRLTSRADVVRQTTAEPFEGITWIIVNYEAVWRNVSKSRRLDDVLAAWQPDLVIADEAHKMKSPSSKQSRALARLGQAAPMKLALTGTPVPHSPLDLYGILRFLDRRAIAHTPSWEKWRKRYGVWGGFEGRELVGFQHLDELIALVRRHSFRVRLEDCFDLPPKTFIDVPIEIPPAARAIYREMRDEMMVELESGAIASADIVLVKLLRLAQITSGHVKDEHGVVQQVHTAKLDACLSMVENMVEQGEKVVVFARFREDLRGVSRGLTARKIGNVVLSGETSAGDRRVVVERFQSGSIPVFVSQVASGSLGIDLSAAKLAIFYSWDYNWATYTQAVERIYQAGKTHALGIYHLVVPQTVDTVSLNVLKARGNLAHAIIHDPSLLTE